MLNQINLSRVDLNLLVVFQAVLEAGHVARAASRVHLTPSAVSHALGRLRHLLNDPLFLRTPKGVAPTARAGAGAAGGGDPGARRNRCCVRGSLRSGNEQAALRDRRTGAVLASTIKPLLQRLAVDAPGIDLGFIHLMPMEPGSKRDLPWQGALEKLERREIDIALLPLRAVPHRFAAARLYDEDFVVAMRKDHPYARAFDRDPAAFLACDWLPPKWDWVDPMKDARAEIEQIRAGLKSRSQSIAERGYDIEEVDAAIAADRAREQRLGLSFDTTVSPDQPAMEGANA